MPKTMTFDRNETALIRSLLQKEVDRAEKALQRVEAAVDAGKKNTSWLIKPAAELDRAKKLLKEAMEPVMVERTNLMSGQKYMEAEDTPNYCSPASEAYWSM